MAKRASGRTRPAFAFSFARAPESYRDCCMLFENHLGGESAHSALADRAGLHRRKEIVMRQSCNPSSNLKRTAGLGIFNAFQDFGTVTVLHHFAETEKRLAINLVVIGSRDVNKVGRIQKLSVHGTIG
jgi:hypothetical protein